MYDLAIVGATAGGRAAARRAAERGARVALVEQGAGLAAAQFYTTALRDRARQQPGSGLAGFQAAIAQANAAIAALEEQESPLVLGDRGVDYLAECGQFVGAAGWSFATATRQLTARAWLLAPAWQARPLAIPGLEATGYLTPEQLWQQPELLPETGRLAIVGATALAVELAQSCQRFGWSVTLLAPQRLLPHLERRVAYLLQAQLEADGVEVLTESEATQARALDGQTWLQAGDRALASDALIVAAGQQPDWRGWNLAARLAIAPDGQLYLNRWLQTSQPRCFACRRSDPAIARTEAAVAVSTILGRARQSVNYRVLPILLATDPPLAAVGLTEAGARYRFGAAALAATIAAQSSSRAWLSDATTGCCTLVARRTGELLGAHALGLEAGEWIGAIALAMQQGLRVADLARLPVARPSGSELVPEVARAWLAQKFS